MGRNNLIDYRVELSEFGLINRVGKVNPRKRLVCGDNHNVKLVNFLELLFLGLSRTGHTRELFI